jgi:hypothetical protein
MNHPVWRPEDGQMLQQLRVNARWDDLVFARANAISLTQLRELEGQGEGSFYTLQIKTHTGYKLLRKLGHEPVFAPESSAETDDAIDDANSTAASLLPGSATDSGHLTHTCTTEYLSGYRASVEIDKAPSSAAIALPLAINVTFSNDQIVTAQPTTADPQCSHPNSTSPGKRISPKIGFSVLMLLAATWAFYSTPWNSLKNLISPANSSGSARSAASFPTSAVNLATHHPAAPTDHAPISDPSTSTTKSLPTGEQQGDLSVQSPSPSLSQPLEYPLATTVARLDCDWRHRPQSLLFEQAFPAKPGNYLHFVALQDASVCVRDQHNQLTTMQLKAGMAQSVYGEPPFLVHSTEWANLHLYYQGHRVSGTPEGEAHWVFKSKPFIAHNTSAPTAMAPKFP